MDSASTRVAIVAFDDAEVLDVAGPFEVFSVAGRLTAPPAFDVHVVAQAPSVTLRHGLTVTPHVTLRDAPEFDLIVVAGGVTDRAERDEALLSWLRERAQRTPHFASICTGAFVLATAGLLSDEVVTTHGEDQAELARRFPALTVVADERWVQVSRPGGGTLHTSGGISAGIDLALHLVQVLADRALAERVARQMEYRWLE